MLTFYLFGTFEFENISELSLDQKSYLEPNIERFEVQWFFVFKKVEKVLVELFHERVKEFSIQSPLGFSKNLKICHFLVVSKLFTYHNTYMYVQNLIKKKWILVLGRVSKIFLTNFLKDFQSSPPLDFRSSPPTGFSSQKSRGGWIARDSASVFRRFGTFFRI